MTKKEKTPSLSKSSPLHKGSLWIWVPILTGTALGIIGNIVFSLVRGC